MMMIKINENAYEGQEIMKTMINKEYSGLTSWAVGTIKNRDEIKSNQKIL